MRRLSALLSFTLCIELLSSGYASHLPPTPGLQSGYTVQSLSDVRRLTDAADSVCGQWAEAGYCDEPYMKELCAQECSQASVQPREDDDDDNTDNVDQTGDDDHADDVDQTGDDATTPRPRVSWSEVETTRVRPSRRAKQYDNDDDDETGMERLGPALVVIVISLYEALLLHLAPVVFAIALLVYAVRNLHRWLRPRAGRRSENLLPVRTSVAPREDTAMNEIINDTAVDPCEGIAMNEVVIGTTAAVPEGEAAGPARRWHILDAISRPCLMLSLGLFLYLFLYLVCIPYGQNGQRCFLPNPVV